MYVIAAGNSPDSGPSFWAIAGPVIAVVALGVSVFLWWRSRERRALTYGVTATQLVRHEGRGRIGIVHDGRGVEDPHLVEVAIGNSGNAPLSHDDFETALQITFDASPEVLSADLAAVEPEDLAPQINTCEHSLTVEPLLLNPGDAFSVQVLISKAPGEVRLKGRIAGVHQFESSPSTPRDRLVPTTVKISMPFLGVVLEREASRRTP